mgnify:CR=1 FL=1
MKSAKVFISVCIALVHTTFYSQNAPWRSMGPDYNTGRGVGRLECIAFDPEYNGTTNQIMYVGSPYGGLWKSINSGENWENKSVNTDMLPALGISDIAIDPRKSQVIYISYKNT